MIKQRILTALGIILSFAIAIGGWALANILMDMRANNLMSAVGVSPILMPLQLPQTEVVEIVYGSEYDPAYPIAAVQVLTEQNIISILRNQNAPGREMPHEPTPGQITMYDAISIGREWLQFLTQYIQIHPEMMHIHDTSAILSQNIQRGGDGFMPPEYSFWTVNFYNRFMTITMKINAVEGQVWYTELQLELRAQPRPWDVTVPTPIFEARDGRVQPLYFVFFETHIDAIVDALYDFVDIIGIDADEVLYRIHSPVTTPVAIELSKTFADGAGHVTTTISGAAVNDENMLFFHGFSMFLGAD